MPSNLLVLVLISGFCFLHYCDRFKFRAQMLDGYRLLLYSSFAGALILLACRCLVSIAKLSDVFWRWKPLWLQFSDIPYLGTCGLCVPVSLAAAGVWNRFIDPELRREAEVARHGDSLQVLMQNALKEDRMVSITFENRKWYAGYVAQAPNLKPNEKYFQLLPVLSGYRDKDTLKVVRTTSYANIDSMGVSPNEFVITLPLDAVKTANFFDPVIYEDNFAGPARAGRRKGRSRRARRVNSSLQPYKTGGVDRRE